MIRVNHSWEDKGDFKNNYYIHILNNLKDKGAKNKSQNKFLKFFLDEKILKTLLFSNLDTLRKDENFLLFWELSDLYVKLDNYYKFKIPKEVKGTKRQELEKYRIYMRNDIINSYNIIKAKCETFDKDFKCTKAKAIFLKLKISNEYLAPIRKIVNYKYITSNLRDGILNSVDVSVCPYCNRNYTDKFKDTIKNKDRNLGYLDHFYNKDTYPFLALSLYNFVPSCNICNSKFKSTSNKEIIYPYSEEFGEDCKFILEFKAPLSVLGIQDIDDIKLEIKSDAKLKEKIKGSIDLFRIEDIYKNHKKEAKDILFKHQCYNDDMKEQLLDILKNKNSIYNEENIDEFIFGLPSVDEIQNTPLGKFKRDIYDYIKD